MSDCMTQEDAANMDNEQAIQILKPLRDMMIDQNGCPISSAVFALDKAIEALSAQPRWIPCSERLPEENGRYLVTRGLKAAGSLWNRVYIANYSDLMGLKSKKIFWGGNVGKSDFTRLEDVIAWMPLPEPYEEEEHERHDIPR